MAAARPKNPARRDPSRRRTQAGIDPTRLMNIDSSLEYKWVLADDRSQYGLRAHENRGWAVVVGVKGGVIPERGACSREGQPVEMDGYTLMSIKKTEAERIRTEGFYGNSGQLLFDEIEEQIIDPEGGIDPARGMTNRWASVLNETKANEFRGSEI